MTNGRILISISLEKSIRRNHESTSSHHSGNHLDCCVPDLEKTDEWMNILIQRFRQEANNDLSMTALRVAIITAALVFIGMALFVNNKWVLAGALAYLVLP